MDLVRTAFASLNEPIDSSRIAPARSSGDAFASCAVSRASASTSSSVLASSTRWRSVVPAAVSPSDNPLSSAGQRLRFVAACTTAWISADWFFNPTCAQARRGFRLPRPLQKLRGFVVVSNIRDDTRLRPPTSPSTAAWVQLSLSERFSSAPRIEALSSLGLMPAVSASDTRHAAVGIVLQACELECPGRKQLRQPNCMLAHRRRFADEIRGDDFRRQCVHSCHATYIACTAPCGLFACTAAASSKGTIDLSCRSKSSRDAVSRVQPFGLSSGHQLFRRCLAKRPRHLSLDAVRHTR